jgi:hypothetical protein
LPRNSQRSPVRVRSSAASSGIDKVGTAIVSRAAVSHYG